MPARRDVPPTLRDRPVSAAELRSAGLSRNFTTAHFVPLFHGVWWHESEPDDHRSWQSAALLSAPKDAVVSHTSALAAMGLPVGSPLPIHLSTNTLGRSRQDRLIVHRRRGPIWRDQRDGLPVTTPERTFVDSATLLGLRDLVRIGDALLHRQLTTLARLTAFAEACHLHGVVRARRAIPYVREGVESFRETDLRLLLLFARLPVDGCNVDILDAEGLFIARGDILLSAYRVLVEYDGWQHERDAKQRQRDHLRREALDGAGWRVIVVTAEDLKNPLAIVHRVDRALRERGWRGSAPVTSLTWHRWFAR